MSVRPASFAAASVVPHDDAVDSPGAARAGDFLPDLAAQWFTAVELAALGLPGLPAQRQHISARATREGWTHRARAGKGGGREFSIGSLPAEARAALVSRRVEAQPTPSPGVPPAPDLARLAALSDRQRERLAARNELLALFDRFRNGRSQRAVLDMFLAGWNGGIFDAPLARAVFPTVARRTLERWSGLRSRGALAPAVQPGRPDFAERCPAAADFLIAAAMRQPHLATTQLRALLRAAHGERLATASGPAEPLPSPRTIGRLLDRWRADNVQLSTLATNPDAWKSRYRVSLGRADAGVERINQRWEIDASPADALCVDGRHSIYVAVDVFSRRGLALVSRTPRADAVLQLVCTAIEKWGVPELIYTDNGKDFIAARTLQAFEQLGIAHGRSPAFTPEAKPHVERLIGTMQRDLIGMLPGFVGANVAERQRIRARKAFAASLGETDGEAFAVEYTAAELQQRLDKWFDNVYARRVHRSLGVAPMIRALDGGAPRMVSDVAALRFLLLTPPADGRTRVVTKRGVQVAGRDFWCDELTPGQTVEVRLDPKDLGVVWCFAAEKPWRFVGRASNPDLAGMDRAEVSARARAEQRETNRRGRALLRRARKGVNERALIDAVLADRDGDRVVALPRAPLPHSTGDLAEAAIAAQLASSGPDRRPPPPAAPAPEEQARHAAIVADFEAASRDRSAAETPEARFARWRRIGRALRLGRAVSPASREWHAIYADTAECKGHRAVADAFGLDADEEEAAGA